MAGDEEGEEQRGGEGARRSEQWLIGASTKLIGCLFVVSRVLAVPPCQGLLVCPNLLEPIVFEDVAVSW
jgi:hypothetical protein